VTPERPLEGGGDIYIAGPHLDEAMHGDRVVVRIERVKDGGRFEGRIIRILERKNSWIVGTYERDEEGMGYVVPFESPRPDGCVRAARAGRRRLARARIVNVELTKWPTADARRDSAASPRCSATSMPGRRHRADHPQVRAFRTSIPRTPVAEAMRLGATVSDRDLEGRSDFRNLVTVTIDGEHAARLRRCDHD
jgi:ribonuclease R